MPPLNTPERIRRAIETKTYSAPGGCLIWTGMRTNDGYGRIKVARQLIMAHRLAYELHVGPIPAGLVIDHLCHTNDSSCPGGRACAHRRCLNPAHFEVVTPDENRRRSGHRSAACRRGHAFDSANAYVTPGGHRVCRACNAAAARRYKERRAMRAAGIAA